MNRPIVALSLSLLAALPLACDEKPSTEAPPSAAASTAATPPGFDVEGFCERVMAVAGSRKCEGDDSIIEGNKIGYCSTMLREARDAERVGFDAAAAKACSEAVRTASDLPDRRVLRDLSLRLEACRKVVVGKVSAEAACDHTMECKPGLLCVDKKCSPAAKEGEVCRALRDDGFTASASTCAVGLSCVDAACKKEKAKALGDDKAPCEAHADCQPMLHCSADKRCAPKKKAGASCTKSDACLGRCSRKDGNTCVSYCGSG